MNTTSRNHPSPLRVLAATVVGAGLAAGLLTGCSSNGLQTTPGGQPSVHEPTPTNSASPSTSTTRASGQSPAGTNTTTTGDSSNDPSSGHSAAAGPGTAGAGTGGDRQRVDARRRCSLNALHVGVRVPDGAGTAGSQYVLLTFQNTSSTACWLHGYPGVSFVGDGNGTQLGASASRQPASAPQVRLGAGDTTTSLLRITDAGNFDAKQCAPTTADGFRVYPPGSRSAAFVRFTTTACQRPLRTGPQLTVSPVAPMSAHGGS